MAIGCGDSRVDVNRRCDGVIHSHLDDGETDHDGVADRGRRGRTPALVPPPTSNQYRRNVGISAARQHDEFYWRLRARRALTFLLPTGA